jgi:hypothetical protein
VSKVLVLAPYWKWSFRQEVAWRQPSYKNPHFTSDIDCMQRLRHLRAQESHFSVKLDPVLAPISIREGEVLD